MELKWSLKVGSLLYRIAVPQAVLLAIAGVSCASALPAPAPAAAKTQAPPAIRRQVLADYVRLPLSFEPNLGQSAAPVKFLSRGQGYGLFLTAGRAVLLVAPPPASPTAAPTFHALSLDLLGSNPAAPIAASGRLPGVSNYLLGDNPREWHTNVPHYARVHYRGVYPGIDLVYYGRQRQLEYDFVVAPGADPARISLQVRGARALSLNAKGDLILELPGGAVQLRRPQVYQKLDGKKQIVPARFVLRDGNRVAFAIAPYDRKRELTIDPRLAYFTYLGGAGNETAPSVAVDSAFNAYVAGTTSSADFPTVSPYQSTLKGTTNVFVTKFNSTGTGVFYSTYLGGSGTDTAAGIAVDRGFNAYVAGTTSSSNFPVTSANAYQTAPKTANNHVFVTELNSSGSALVYSTYLSGSNADSASGVAVGPLAGTVFVTGTTQSTDFANVARPATLTGSSEFFVTKLYTARQGAASLLYSTYIGGNTPKSGSAITNGGGIAVDASNNAYITGGTNYTDMPVVNAYQATLKGTENAFVAKLNPNGASTFLTYLGGSGTDIGSGIATDSAGNAYVTGSTTSSDFPVVAAAGVSAYQGAFAGTTDGFLTKVAAAGTSLIWSTFIGAGGNTAGAAVAVDAFQNTFVTGTTDGTVTAVNATQSANAGGTDAFVGEFNVSGAAQFVTYLGGGGNDRGTGIALDSNGNSYVAGETASTGLATTGVYQTALNGNNSTTASDAFVAHFAGVSALNLQVVVSPNPVGIGNSATFTFTVSNTGPDIATAVVFTDSLPSNGTFQNATPSQGTCSAAAGLSFSCSLGQLPVNASATVTVHIAGTAAGPLSDSATVSSSSTTGSSSAGASTTVNDFAVAVSPGTASTPAGQAATYTVTLSPIPQGAVFPNGISLKCSAGVPKATTCDFSTNPVTPGATPVTSSMVLTTTALPPGTPTAFLFRPNLRRMFAIMLPLGGVAFLGFSLGGDGRRRKRLAAFLLLGFVLAVMALQPACSSSKSKPAVPPFTPAGTYNITVVATSGVSSHTTQVVLVVK